MNIFTNGNIHSNGVININGIRIDFDDIIGTCKRLLETVSDEEKIQFAKDILAETSNQPKQKTNNSSATIKEERDISVFDNIEIDASCRVFYREGIDCAVSVEGTQKAIDNISTVVENGVLKVKQKRNYPNVKSTKVFIQSEGISSLRIKGSCDFMSQSSMDEEDNDLAISMCGSGFVVVPEIKCANLSVDILSSGDVKIVSLEAESTDATVQGSGDISFKDFKIRKTARLAVQGSGDIDVNGCAKKVNAAVQGSGDISGKINCDTLAASVMGSGDIDLSGNIKSHTQSVMGSGDININQR